MEARLCPIANNCPVFKGIITGKEATTNYKNLFCNGGNAGRSYCRRYQVVSIVGICSPDILPNSSKTTEEILQAMRDEGFIN